jgi:hypothetical protein
MSKIGRKEILKYFKLILVSLDMSVKSYSTSDFMPHFCSILGMYCSKVTTRKGFNKINTYVLFRIAHRR